MDYLQVCIINSMTFSEWLEQKFVEWRGSRRRGVSIDAFAKSLGVSQPTMSKWLAGQKMPGREAIAKIAKVYPDVYDILNLETISDLDGLPPNIQERLRRATEEVNNEFKRRGLTGDVPEAEALTIQIFEKWGFKYTATETANDG